MFPDKTSNVVYPPKFLHFSIVLISLGTIVNPKRNLKQCLFGVGGGGGGNKVHYGIMKIAIIHYFHDLVYSSWTTAWTLAGYFSNGYVLVQDTIKIHGIHLIPSNTPSSFKHSMF